MPPRGVLVTYTLYPSGNGDLRTALAGVEAQLPLRNLHWKSSSRTSLRTIQEVDVRMVELGDVPPPKDQLGASVLDPPLVNICFVACDDSDIYKNNTRSFIKDWLSLLQSRKNSSHTSLIVLVNPPTASGAVQSSKNVFGRDKGIIAKLKADFNTKRDICVLLNLPPTGANDPAAWPDLINKLKESIVLAFDGAILEREEEVKRGEAQCVAADWNFCTWFLLKESLAHSFEGVHLYEDALIIYEELEASFLQCLKEQKLNWLDNLGATGPHDDSLSVLDITAKPYRDMLTSSTVSVFDFRIYVFACQCILLGKIGRITEIAKRGQWFIASLSRRLRENQFPRHFIESWTHSACMDLVASCDDWSRIDRPNNDYSGLIAYESARAELLDIARIQVERMGVAVGYLPNMYPFRSNMTPFKPEVGANRQPLSNPTFLDALQSREDFLALYEDLTEKALMAYEACGKVNSAIRLKADLAALSMHLADYGKTFNLFRSLVRDCVELNVWDQVAKFAIEGALVAHKQLHKPHDDDWADLALAYLTAFGTSTSLHVESQQLEAVVEGLTSFEESREVFDNPAFHIRLLNTVASPSADVSVTELALQINNRLPVPVSVADVGLNLESEVVGVINYSSGPVVLYPGHQSVPIVCSTSIAGVVTLSDAYVSLGRFDFVTPFPKGQVSVPIHRNLLGLRAALRMPPSIFLDAEPRVRIEIHSGKQAVQDVRIALGSLQDEVSYALDRAACTSRELELHSDYVGVGQIEHESIIAVDIPYSGAPRNELAKAHIVVQYTSPAGRVCRYIDEQTLFMGLPLTVNVQDFFRPDVLISSFSVASDGREYLRVGSVELRSPENGFSIEPCRESWEETLLVAPAQPLACLFKVYPKTGQPPKAEVLRLSIRYYTIDEEVEALSQAALDALPKPCTPLARVVGDRIANRGSWLQPFLLSGKAASVFDDEWVHHLPPSVPQAAAGAFVSALASVKPHWRTLQIPVEVPLRRLLTTVRITPSAPVTAVYEGRAMRFDLSLSTSFAWIGQRAEQDLRVSYDIHANADDWVVAGKKRGVYIAAPDHPVLEQIVLVPVRQGTLALPPVSVQLVSETAEAADRILCETYVANAAQGVHILPSRTGMAALVPVAAEWES